MTEAEGREKACNLLGVSLPVSYERLKSAFRAASHMLHPDKGGDADRFKEMTAFYRDLLALNASWAFTEEGAVKLFTTVTGDSLASLGLGVPFPKNGKPCVPCRGAGYTVEESFGTIRCRWCLAGWAYVQPCSRCKGTGEFQKNGKVVGNCFGCHGTGTYQLKRLVRCRVCDGHGESRVAVGTKLYHTCVTCHGCGEMEVWNPVIPRGLLAGFKK